MLSSEREISGNYERCCLSVLPTVLITFILCVTSSQGAWYVISCMRWRAAEIGVFLETDSHRVMVAIGRSYLCTLKYLQMNYWTVPATLSLSGAGGKGTNEQLRSSATDKDSVCASKSILGAVWLTLASVEVKLVRSKITLSRMKRWCICRSKRTSLSCLTWSHKARNYISVSKENWQPSTDSLQGFSPGSPLLVGAH